jgi:hypothetical protein
MSDLARAVREIVGENGSYYLLGYYPNPSVTDGKFHELKVYVNRPGVRVRARQGYVAPMTGKAAATATAASALDTAMSAGVNVAGLPIRVFAAPLAAGPKGVATAVSVEVTYPAPTDGSRAIDDTIDLGVIAVDPDGKIKAQSKREMRFTATLTAPASGPLTFLMDDAIDLPSQPLTLRVGVASRTLGAAGTSQMPIDVPKLSSSHVQLTGVVIGFDGAPREPSLNAAVIGPLVPFQPTAARAFAASDTLSVYTRAFWGGKESAADVTVTVSGPVSFPAKTVTLTGSRTNGHAEATLDTTVPLASLAAGKYVLTIDAHLANGESARRTVPFDIESSSPR